MQVIIQKEDTTLGQSNFFQNILVYLQKLSLN